MEAPYIPEEIDENLDKINWLSGSGFILLYFVQREFSRRDSFGALPSNYSKINDNGNFNLTHQMT